VNRIFSTNHVEPIVRKCLTLKKGDNLWKASNSREPFLRLHIDLDQLKDAATP
jgi:hypothetical protein